MYDEGGLWRSESLVVRFSNVTERAKAKAKKFNTDLLFKRQNEIKTILPRLISVIVFMTYC